MNGKNLGGKALDVQIVPSDMSLAAMPGLPGFPPGVAMPGMPGFGFPGAPPMDPATAAMLAAQGMGLPGPPPGAPVPGQVDDEAGDDEGKVCGCVCAWPGG